MNAKIITVLERHVEKIVLAVAVAGAGVIAWYGMQPTTLGGDPNGATPGQVENKVTEAVANLEKARQETAQIPESKLTSALHDYVGDYQRIMLKHPLSENLVASVVPRFGPTQMPLTGMPGGGEDHGNLNQGSKIASAKVPAPKNVTAVADRGSVLPPTDPSQPVPAPGMPGAPQPVDKNWVCVSGDIPWGDYVNYFKNLPADQRLPDEQQHNVLDKVEVQRRSRTATGWTDWTAVPATTAGAGGIPNIDWDQLNEADWISTVTQLDASFARIAEPIFYNLAPKDPLTQPPTPILSPNAKAMLAAQAAAAATPGTPGGPGAIPPRPGMPVTPGAPGGVVRPGMPTPPGGIVRGIPQPQQQPIDSEGDTENPTPMAMQPVPGLNLDVNTLKQSGTVPFWFWDETVQAGQEYQYRVRLVMYNPLYRYPEADKRLADPATAKAGTVASPWVTVPTPVKIQGDVAFYVDNAFGSGSGQKVSFTIFKWTNGMWCRTSGSQTVDLAGHVAGRVHSPDANHPYQTDVDTGYTLVDARSGKGGDVTATLLTPTGELITRNSMTDSNDPEHKTLNDQTKPIAKPVVPKPAPQPRAPVVPQRGPGFNPDDQ